MDSILKINSKEEFSSFEEEFTGILSRAFYNDPFYVWIMPDDNKRIQQIEWWMRILLKYTLLYGEIHYTEDRKAVAMWLGPDRPIVNDFKIFSMGLILYPIKIGIRNFMRALDISGQWDKEHKKMDKRHYYLMVIAVEPELQGKGIGSRLMQLGLKKADNDGLECFLETVTPEDVQFYRKHNFDVIFNKGFGLKDQYWIMTRKPSALNNNSSIH
jgi:ribosomal protein S18 acetylase RimI-like enzyme